MPRYVRLSDLDQFAAVDLRSDGGAVGGKVKIPNAAQFRIGFNLTGGKVAYMVTYGRYTGTFSVTQAQVQSALAALVSGATWTALAAHLAPTVTLSIADVRDVNTEDQPLISSSGGGAPGASTGTAIPDENALVITLFTAKAGKSGRGRMYFPGWATTALGTGGSPASAATTALTNWANSNLANAFTAMNMTQALGLKERKAYVGITGTQHPARPARTEDVTGRVVRTASWDSQRRRGKK